jgi:hypothetical protein
MKPMPWKWKVFMWVAVCTILLVAYSILRIIGLINVNWNKTVSIVRIYWVLSLMAHSFTIIYLLVIYKQCKNYFEQVIEKLFLLKLFPLLHYFMLIVIGFTCMLYVFDSRIYFGRMPWQLFLICLIHVSIYIYLLISSIRLIRMVKQNQQAENQIDKIGQ